MTDSRDLIRRMADALIAGPGFLAHKDSDRELIAEALAYLERPTELVIGDVRFVSDVHRMWHSEEEEWRVTIYMMMPGDKLTQLDWAFEPTRPAAEAKAADMLEAINASFAGGSK